MEFLPRTKKLKNCNSIGNVVLTILILKLLLKGLIKHWDFLTFKLNDEHLILSKAPI